MKGSDRLTSCTKDLIDAVVEYLYSEECPDEYKQDCDYRVILLTGLILCVNLTVCRNDTPEGWFFARESNEYKRVNSIVLDLFNHRDTQEGTVEWRSLMRIMCAFMGLFSYFNRGN